MRRWLLKSEPDTFSIEDLVRDGTTEWSGVRNYQARNLMREMQPGDRAFFYHSNARPPGVAGECEIVAAAHPDSTQFDAKSDYYDERSPRDEPRWWCVDVGRAIVYPRFVTLDELRNVESLAGMALLQRGQRLSVMPVSAKEWSTIERLARRKS